jgi:large subunit ribosomal protein L29
MKIDSMVEWSAEERTAKEKEWRQALFTLRLQQATGQLDNPMKLKELRKDIARLKTLVHMEEARVAAQKAHAEHEASLHVTAAAGAAVEGVSEPVKKATRKTGKKASPKGKARTKPAAKKAAPRSAKKPSPAKKAASKSAKKGKGR